MIEGDPGSNGQPHRPLRGHEHDVPVKNRRLRYSVRYATYQITDRVTGQWRNLNEPMYLAYVAAGIREILVQPDLNSYEGE